MLTILLVVDFIKTVSGVLNDVVPAMALLRSLVYVVASLNVTVFFYVFQRARLDERMSEARRRRRKRSKVHRRSGAILGRNVRRGGGILAVAVGSTLYFSDLGSRSKRCIHRPPY